MATALQVLVLFLIPWGLVYVSKATRLEKILSPVILCYGLGLLLFQMLPENGLDHEGVNITSQISIALALPLIMMTSDFGSLIRSGRNTLVSFASAILVVCGVCVLGAFLFEGKSDNIPEMSAMLAGVYSGGTPNMAAIKQAIGADATLFGVMNIADILMSGIFFIFLTTIGPKVYRFLLPASAQEELKEPIEQKKESFGIKDILVSIGLAILCAALAAGFSYVVIGGIHDGLFVIGATIFGIIVSFLPFAGKIKGAYETGDYLLLVFSLALGLMSDFAKLAEAGMLVLGFTAFVLFVSVILHLILCRIFKVDADTALITSTACIFGPVFIGQVVSVMGNRKVLVPGMAMGVAGLAIGSFLGMGLYWILS